MQNTRKEIINFGTRVAKKYKFVNDVSIDEKILCENSDHDDKYTNKYCEPFYTMTVEVINKKDNTTDIYTKECKGLLMLMKHIISMDKILTKLNDIENANIEIDLLLNNKCGDIIKDHEDQLNKTGLTPKIVSLTHKMKEYLELNDSETMDVIRAINEKKDHALYDINGIIRMHNISVEKTVYGCDQNDIYYLCLDI